MTPEEAEKLIIRQVVPTDSAIFHRIEGLKELTDQVKRLCDILEKREVKSEHGGS